MTNTDREPRLRLGSQGAIRPVDLMPVIPSTVVVTLSLAPRSRRPRRAASRHPKPPKNAGASQNAGRESDTWAPKRPWAPKRQKNTTEVCLVDPSVDNAPKPLVHALGRPESWLITTGFPIERQPNGAPKSQVVTTGYRTRWQPEGATGQPEAATVSPSSNGTRSPPIPTLAVDHEMFESAFFGVPFNESDGRFWPMLQVKSGSTKDSDTESTSSISSPAPASS